ncbi:MAG: ATP synthase F0 subunit B [Candidatus Sericytochromatia bacterium]|nr:ATP synthase F0 subunit B [Candidatus Sericytochromatia bacterium]
MEFNVWHAIANIFNFLLFVVVIVKFAGPVIAKAVRDSQESTKQAIVLADEALASAETALAETRARLANVDDELAAMLADARQLADHQAAKMARAAEEEVARLRSAAHDEIGRERQAAVNALRQALAEQAFENAASAIRASMNAERQNALVANLIQKVGDGSLALK